MQEHPEPCPSGSPGPLALFRCSLSPSGSGTSIATAKKLSLNHLLHKPCSRQSMWEVQEPPTHPHTNNLTTASRLQPVAQPLQKVATHLDYLKHPCSRPSLLAYRATVS